MEQRKGRALTEFGTLTPLQVVYVVIAVLAMAVSVRLWLARRNAQVVRAYMRVFSTVQANCITAEPFFRHLCHLKAVLSTRPKDEVLHFDTAPEKLLESYVKQQMRNADPEYKLFDERLCWQLKTIPPTEINLPATPWMNEFVVSLGPPQPGPSSVASTVARLNEAIDCVRDLPHDIQVVPGVSADGRVGVHLQEPSKLRARRDYVRGYLVLAALWCLHSALLLAHGRTWGQLANDPERLILAFGPPLAGYALMRIAFWVRPVVQRVKEPEAVSLRSFLFQSLGDRPATAEKMHVDARVSAGR